MKKIDHSLKCHNDIKSRKRTKRRKKYIPNFKILSYHHNVHENLLVDQVLKDHIDKIIESPFDLSFVDNSEECLLFFEKIRSGENIIENGNKKFIQINLKNVTKIDYGTICVLKAILYELNHNEISIRGNFPDDISCKHFIIESGFLNYLVDDKGNKFRKVKDSEIVFFQKSADEFSDEEMKKLGEKIKMIMFRLTGVSKHNQSLRSVILEVCGNSIEHSKSLNNHWVIGFYFDKDKVTITITDIGKGIIETLFFKFGQKIVNLLNIKDDLNVLKGAYIRKYGSSTLEQNRNKGLPLIKQTSEDNKIANLVVITNNVILHFDDDKSSRIFKQELKFFGTFYQWEINRNCLF